MRPVWIDLLAHAPDVNVDAALDRSGHAAVGEVEQSLTREDLPRVPAEGEQQIELGARHRHLDVIGVAQLTRRRIDRPPVEAEGGRTVRAPRAPLGCA